MELLGFALCSPFELLLHPAPAAQTAAELMQRVGKEAVVVGYLVTVKDTRTAKGERMQFGTFIDKQGEYIDTVHFPPVAARYPFRGRGIYWLKGRVTEEFDCYTLEVMEMEKLPIIPDPRYAEPARQSATQSAA
jgi:DNA polymerase-3 subunit alpha